MVGRVYVLTPSAFRLLQQLRNVLARCPTAARVLGDEFANRGQIFVPDDEGVAALATNDVVRLKESGFLVDLAAAANAIEQLDAHGITPGLVH